MAKWYDPLTERWHQMPEKPAPVKVFEPEENSVTKVTRIVRQLRIWQAVVSTSTSSQMGTTATEPDECLDGSETVASES